MISLQKSRALTKILEATDGVAAEFDSVELYGIDVTLVVVKHDSQVDGEWQTLHVLGNNLVEPEHLSLGVIPEKEEM